MKNNPEVSIIILSYDNLNYTKGCINSIFEHTSQAKTPFEIIVVDNGSQDGTRQYLEGLEKGGQVKAIYNAENAGFPKGNNQAAEIAQGRYLLLLNNDTIVTEGWLEKMLRCIRSDTKLAAVGPYANYDSGFQESPAKCTYKGAEELQKFASKYSQSDKEVDFLVFFCTLIKRSAWDEIGGLDEDFTPGNYEDNLFCWRVIEKGYKMRVVGSCFVHHFVSKTWEKEDKKKSQSYASIVARNQKLFMKKIGKYRTIALCMIVSDQENPATLKQCLDSVAGWVDEINIVFNYKWWPSKRWQEQGQDFPVKFRNEVIERIPLAMNRKGDPFWRRYPNYKTQYLKWINFSDMRNLSFKMVATDYILWLDTDDIMLHPSAMRDLILRNPDVDAFRCHIISSTETKSNERILHPRLLKNHPWLHWRNRCHEDIQYSLKENKAKMVLCNMEIRHTGNVTVEAWKRKNLHYYKLLMQDYNDKPHSLTYYGLVNALMIIGGIKNWERAISLIDECFEKFKLGKEDPIYSKMWMLRGVCCMDCNQWLAAKQSLHKAFDECKDPEAAVNLADCYMREKKWDKAIEILDVIYEMKELRVSSLPIDPIQIESLMLAHLGDCWGRKAQEKGANKIEHMLKAEKYYRECLSVKADLGVADRLCQILRNTKRWDEAVNITHRMVNKFPKYAAGFFNIGQYEMMHKRSVTARVFWQEALRINPKYVEARHNLKTLEGIRRRNGH